MSLVFASCGSQHEAEPSASTEPRATRSAACAQAQGPPVLERVDVTVEGTARTALVHVPQRWDGTTAIPVVMSFHGADESATVRQLSDGLAAKGDAEGFIVVHPDGLIVDVNDEQTDVKGWDVLGRKVDEPAFVSAVLAEVGQQLCVDLSRVYATGFSNGGDMALAAACALPERIAAVAKVSAGDISVPCASGRPTPTVAFHGRGDMVVPYDGASEIEALPVEQVLGDQATRNRCAGGPDTQPVTPTVESLTWTGCEAPVVLYRLRDHGHAWPGLPVPFSRDLILANFTPPNSVMVARGLTSEAMADNVMLTNNEINATDLMWEFFQSASR